jgi:hypothetical protein
MPTLSQQVSKPVFVKIRGNDLPVAATLTNVDEHGVWLVGETLGRTLTRANLPSYLAAKPDVFVPFDSLDWLMVQTA